MANVKIEMEVAQRKMRGDGASRPKVRRNRFIEPKTLAAIKKLDSEMKEAAEKRGAWKDASPEDRVKAKEMVKRMKKLQAEARAQQAEAVEREKAKQKAAAEREKAYQETK